MQKEGQLFDSFLTELKKSVKSCEYANEEEMVRDKIVLGVSDKAVQERLLREDALDLSKAVKYCRVMELSKTHSKVLQAEVTVIAIQTKRNKKTKDLLCKVCGTKHEFKKETCPTFGKQCVLCQGEII